MEKVICKDCPHLNNKTAVCIDCHMGRNYIRWDDFLQKFILVTK